MSTACAPPIAAQTRHKDISVLVNRYILPLEALARTSSRDLACDQVATAHRRLVVLLLLDALVVVRHSRQNGTAWRCSLRFVLW